MGQARGKTAFERSKKFLNFRIMKCLEKKKQNVEREKTAAAEYNYRIRQK